MKRSYLWSAIIPCCIAVTCLALLGSTRLWGQGVAAQGLTEGTSNAFIFRLELGGQVVAEYTECFGLGSSNDIEETVSQMDAGPVKQKTPGPLNWPQITLRRTGPGDPQVWAWRKTLEDGRLDQAVRNGAIVMFLSGLPQAIARWEFRNAWPARLTIEGSVEELVIVHDRVERVGASEIRPGPQTGR